MPTDAAFAMERVRQHKLELYFGFDPDAEYVVRARNREFGGFGHGIYQFTAGQTIVGRMKPTASEDQKWNRGERLAQFRKAGLAVYKRGDEPSRADDPLWAHLPKEKLDDAGEDTGESGAWVPIPERQETPQRLTNQTQPTGEATPSVV